MKRETELLFQAIVMAIFVTGWNKRYNSPVETVAKSYFRCRRDERGLDGDGSFVAWWTKLARRTSCSFLSELTIDMKSP